MIKITKEQKKQYEQLVKACTEYYKEVMEYGYRDSDDPHYIYEIAMLFVLGNDVFKVMNKRDSELAERV